MLDLAPISVLVRGPALEQEDQQRIAVLLHHAHAFTTLVDRLARALDRTPVGFLLQVLGRLDLGGPEVRLEALVPRPPPVDPLACPPLSWPAATKKRPPPPPFQGQNWRPLK